jgi:hypothetical protein
LSMVNRLFQTRGRRSILKTANDYADLLEKYKERVMCTL